MWHGSHLPVGADPARVPAAWRGAFVHQPSRWRHWIRSLLAIACALAGILLDDRAAWAQIPAPGVPDERLLPVEPPAAPEPRVIPGMGPPPPPRPAAAPAPAPRPTAVPAPRAAAAARPLAGVTVPQPTGRVVEPKPIDRIREPEALSRAVVLEAPGQPRVAADGGPVLSVAPSLEAPGRATPLAGPRSAPPRALTLPRAGRAETGQPGPVLGTDPRPGYGPDTFVATARAAELYRAIADRGGWPTLPEDTYLTEGASGPKVATLKQILVTVGDLPDRDALSTIFDAATARAVRAFQMRHGLAQTGIVSARTLEAMNVPARVRAAQLANSAQRLAQSGFGFGPRYVVVNIPAAVVEAVENGSVARRYAAVVGRPDRPSPILDTRITAINLSPFWTAPASIVAADIAPAMQKDPHYLARARIRIFDAQGRERDPATIDWRAANLGALTFRQDPGAGNALGRVRIDMPNSQAVYLHDTPSRQLFAGEDRFHSSGCVRVADPLDLSARLLAEPRRPAGMPARAIAARFRRLSRAASGATYA